MPVMGISFNLKTSGRFFQVFALVQVKSVKTYFGYSFSFKMHLIFFFSFFSSLKAIIIIIYAWASSLDTNLPHLRQKKKKENSRETAPLK